MGGLRLFDQGAGGVYGVNLLLVEADGREVDAIVLLEKNSDLDGINRLQPATSENRRIVGEGFAISLLRQEILQQIGNCWSAFHELTVN